MLTLPPGTADLKCSTGLVANLRLNLIRMSDTLDQTSNSLLELAVLGGVDEWVNGTVGEHQHHCEVVEPAVDGHSASVKEEEKEQEEEEVVEEEHQHHCEVVEPAASVGESMQRGRRRTRTKIITEARCIRGGVSGRKEEEEEEEKKEEERKKKRTTRKMYCCYSSHCSFLLLLLLLLLQQYREHQHHCEVV